MKASSAKKNSDRREVRVHDVRYKHSLAEDSVFSIEMLLFCVSYEELGFVRIRARVGHSNDTTCIELQCQKMSDLMMMGDQGYCREKVIMIE